MNQLRYLSRCAALAVVVAALAACGGGIPADASPVASDQVSVTDDRFDASVVSVPIGATVTWTWRGSNPHDVAGGGWGSDVQTSGTFQHTFTSAGTFDYVCHVHPGMTGRVIVGA